MRARVLFASVCVVVLLVTAGGVSGAQGPRPQAAEGVQASTGTAFTYQGRLTDNGAPADGSYDFRFALYNAASGGSQVGSTLTLDNVQVDKGLFTVQLDFGNVFDGTALWLAVSVRQGNSNGNFTTLDPRQPLTATPYALHSTSAWNLSGNAGTTAGTNFLGTTDGQPLVIKTNNTEALRVDPAGNVGIGTAGPGGRFEVSALASGGIAVMGTSTTRAVLGRLGIISCPGTFAVGGCAGDTGAAGVKGDSSTGNGVQGSSSSGRGVQGFADTGIGVIGNSNSRAVIGTLGGTSCAGTYAVGGCGADRGDGVVGRSTNGAAVRAATTNGSIFVGEAPSGTNRARIDSTGKGFFNGGTQTGGADYAESMRATDAAGLEPGDVLEIDPQQGYAVRQSAAANSRLVAGVYSTQPSVLATGKHGIDDSLAGEVPVALLGVVPTKVSAENGPIEVGDLLVTSSLPGRAMKAQPQMINGVAIYPTGAILGKALEPLAAGTGVIQVLVTLR